MSFEDSRQRTLRLQLHELGFDEVRFAEVPVDAPSASRTLQAWVAAGMHADMHWMERSMEKRGNPQLVLPGARSMILLGVNYWARTAPRNEKASAARWARYALYDDYHDTLKPALVEAGKSLESIFGVSGTDYRYYVDTGPVVERGWAARSGLGFVGKNAMLISRQHGNWLFLASILTRVVFAPDLPLRKTITDGAATAETLERSAPPVGLLCGKCTRCLDECPTDAFAAPGVVDARRCISYQTIENRGVIPRELRAGIGDRIFGCDACLEVCPWNRFAREGRRLLLASRADLANLSLRELLSLSPQQFSEIFRRTPIKRLKLVGLLRNACIVAGNSGDRTLLPPLIELATRHPESLVRAHAVWAAYQLGAGGELESARLGEKDPLVLAEYAAATG